MSKTVLIVEDEFLVAMDLEDIVSQAGYSVIGIAPDQETVSRMDALPDVALVDLNLRDGPTGLAIARSLVAKGKTTVIFVTANPRQISDPPIRSIGYVQKPFSADAILTAIDYAANGANRRLPHGLHLFHD